jgi:HlyD family secretion protein
MWSIPAIRRLLTPKRLTLLVIGALVVAGVGRAMRPDALEVEIAVARTARLRVTVDAEGRTRVRDHFVIDAPVTGRLARLVVEEGDLVRAGDAIARIAPAALDAPAERQAQARLDLARALEREALTRVRLAEAAAAQAARDAQRARRLEEAEGLSKRELEDAELLARTRGDDVAAARARASASAADVAQATAALLAVGGGPGSVVSVRAPAGGRVLRLPERSARVVSAGTAIAEIGDTRALEVVVDVLSADAARICEGMSVSIEGWGGDDAVTGRVRLVEPAARTRISALGVEEQRVDVLVDVPDPPPSLGDGFRVDARIEVWAGDGVLAIPASALVRAGSGWSVFILDAGRALLRPVEVGHMGEGAAEVRNGIASGDVVIVFPSDKVRDGVRVRPRR